MGKVLFVCTANICRSPTAQTIFQKLVFSQQLPSMVSVDSAGTHANDGVSADSRSAMTASRKGVNLSGIYSRALTQKDFCEFDNILVMDQKHLESIQRKWPEADHSRVSLLLKHNDSPQQEIPAPYKGETEDVILAY